MYLLISALLFAGFMVNMIMGTIGYHSSLGDVGEMLLLFLSVIIFVIALLKKEAAENRTLHIADI